MSDLKEELIIAEQEKDKAMKERKIAEDFETQLLREVKKMRISIRDLSSFFTLQMKEKDEKIEYLESQLNQKVIILHTVWRESFVRCKFALF